MILIILNTNFYYINMIDNNIRTQLILMDWLVMYISSLCLCLMDGMLLIYNYLIKAFMGKYDRNPPTIQTKMREDAETSDSCGVIHRIGISLQALSHIKTI